MNELLTCTALTKKFGATTALKGVDLTLTCGKIIGLLGPNGSGKTTFMKLANGLLTPSSGEIMINGMPIGPETKAVVSYLPDARYLPDWMKILDLVNMFAEFYADFNPDKAKYMLESLNIMPDKRFKYLSKGNKEKVQLVLAMSREAQLYMLDEPIGGVDPAARDYILNTIISNYSEHATVVISTHLIRDVESILDEAIFIKEGEVVLHTSADALRETQGMSMDEYFREVFRC
ncbi:MAG: ABC transporter ATP-binding protein [Faecalibacterium sp.]